MKLLPNLIFQRIALGFSLRLPSDVRQGPSEIGRAMAMMPKMSKVDAPQGKQCAGFHQLPDDADFPLDPVEVIVNHMKGRVAQALRHRHSHAHTRDKDANCLPEDYGTLRWEEREQERNDVERRFNAAKTGNDTSVRMFFEHITHSGGTKFCKLMHQERLVEPESNCLASPWQGAHWTKSIWQLGKTGEAADAFVKSFNASLPFNAIANEDLMPANPLFGKGFLYVTTLRNPYTRHVTDIRRSHDDFNHMNGRSQIPLDNYEVRHLCGEPCRDVPFGGIREEHLSTALDNLAHFSFVGPTEHAPCFETLAERLSWDVKMWRNSLEDLNQETQEAATDLQRFLDDGNTDLFNDFLSMHVYDEMLYGVAKSICKLQRGDPKARPMQS